MLVLRRQFLENFRKVFLSLPKANLGRALILPFLCMLASSWTQAYMPGGPRNAATVSEETVEVELGGFLEILEDPAGQFSFDQVAIERSVRGWQPNTKDILNLGYSSSVYWLRFAIKNDDTQRLHRILEFGYPLLDEVKIFLQRSHQSDTNALPEPIIFGDIQPFSARSWNHRSFILPVDLFPGETIDVHIRIETNSSIQLPLTLWEQQRFFEVEQYVILAQGIYFGIMMIMMIYNLFLFFSVRENSYLYYIVAVFFILMVQASIRGYCYQFLWPDSPGFHNASIPLFVSLGVAAVAIFSISFLDLKKHNRFFLRLLQAIVFILVVNSLAIPLMGYSFSIQLAIVVGAVFVLFGLAAGLYTWHKGYRPAAYYSWAYFVLFIGTLLIVLSKLGYIPRNYFTENAQQIGSLIEVVILSFALAYKVALLRLEKQQAEAKLKANLESEVQKRTSELNATLNQLELLNHKLARQSREDGLTGALNRRAFEEHLDIEWKRAQRSHSPVGLIIGDIDHFKMINDQHGHLVGDDCLKRVCQVLRNGLKRSGDNLYRFGGEEFALLLPDTDLEGAIIVAERMRQLTADIHMEVSHQVLVTTMSFGVASAVPTSSNSMQDLVFGADQALYRAKEGGRNRVEPTNSIEQPSF